MVLTKTYPLEIETELWDKIKGTVPRDESLNDTVVDRLETITFSPQFERTADNRGRVKLPSEYAEKDVVVIVVDTEGQ